MITEQLKRHVAAADGKPEVAWDVLVFGGGPAGICAAIQAARAGARTLLVEKSSILGGTMVAGGVAFPGLFHAPGRQVIAGIGWNLVVKSAGIAGLAMPNFADNYGNEHWRHHVRIEPAVFAALADQAVLDSGASLLLHTMPATVSADAFGWAVGLCLKEGIRMVHARVLIDCTGDANVVQLAGLPLRRNPHLQPGTIMFQADGFSLAGLDFMALEREGQEAIQAGELLASDLGRRERPCEHFLRVGGVNRTHIPAVDASGSSGRTEMELAGRRCLLRLFRFFRRQPGLEGFRIRWFALECGIRETVTTIGKATITLEDYLAGRTWPDAICYGYYPIDLHQTDGLGIDIRPLPPGVIPTIPLGALLPADSRQLLVAGRCISTDHESNSACRTQPICMATGQATGAIAALAVAGQCDVAAVNLRSVRELLRKHQAIVPDC